LGTWSAADGTYFTAILRDISERRLAQEALRASEEKFRALLDSSAAAVFIIDDDHLRYANAAARALTGIDPAEAVGKAFLDLFHPDSHEIVRRRVLHAPSPAVEGLRYEARLADALDRWVEVTGRTLEFGGRPAKAGDLMAIVSDGMTEAFSDLGEEFGEERLLRLLEESRDRPLAGLVDVVVGEVRAFSGSQQDDDQTLLVARGR
ncbi:MAG TPA: PAS domain S-box protein, partial [Vicinamibacteria bacterium]|nr:PAS domain S-box protein [Vicinamibacteria bacterium]